MRRLCDAGLSVGVAAAASQQHSFIFKTDIVYYGELIVRLCLGEGPEKVVCCSHQKRAAFDGIFFIPSKRRTGIFPGNAVEALDECLQPGRNGPEVKGRGKDNQISGFDLRNQLLEAVLLDTGLSISACIAAQASFHLIFQ